MKTIIILNVFFLSIFFPSMIFSQNLEKQMSEIQSKCDLIISDVNDSAYNTRTIVIDCPDFPAYGFITFYSEGSELRLVEFTANDGGHSGETWQYFIWNRKLIFCYLEGGYWTFTGGVDTIIDSDTLFIPFTKDNNYEASYFFYKNQPIKCFYKAFEINSSQENNPNSETTLYEEIVCDTEQILISYSQLLKLNDLIFQNSDCSIEILNFLTY